VAAVRRIDECLTVVDGRLRVEGCEAHALAERHGTPLHVVSEDQLRRNLRRILAAFKAAWPHGPVRLLPAIKANPTLALRRVLDEEGAGCDAFGPWELEAALRAGTPPGRISFNGPAKDDDALARAVTLGVRITADSLEELERLDAVARRLGARAAVRLRLRPHVAELTASSDLLEAPVPIADAVLAYKPGIPGDQVAAAGALIAGGEGLDALGVHMHLPRHAADPNAWAVAMRAYAALIAELSAAAGGWRPREVDVGGGFPSARDPAGRALARRHRSRPSPPPSAPSSPQRCAAPACRSTVWCSRPSPGGRCTATPACTLRACCRSSASVRPPRTPGSRPTPARRSCPTGSSSTTAGPCSPPAA
jgi:diaminopimelate decarboxylase